MKKPSEYSKVGFWADHRARGLQTLELCNTPCQVLWWWLPTRIIRYLNHRVSMMPNEYHHGGIFHRSARIYFGGINMLRRCKNQPWVEIVLLSIYVIGHEYVVGCERCGSYGVLASGIVLVQIKLSTIPIFFFFFAR